MAKITADILNLQPQTRAADNKNKKSPDKQTEDYKLFEEWLKFCEVDGLEEETLRGYRHNVTLFLWWWHHSGNADKVDPHPRNVTVKVAREYAAYLRNPVENRWGVAHSKTTLSPATVANYGRALKVWFNWLDREGYIEATPFTRAVKFNTRKPDKTIKHLPLDELTKLFAYLTDPERCKTFVGSRDLAVITLLLDSGIRLGELVSVTVENLDMINLRCKITGKTGTRFALFSERCRDALKVYLKFREKQEDPDGPLWYSEDNYPLTHNGMVIAIRRISDKSGVKFHPHMFRHTFGLLMSNKVSAFELKEMMGHESVKTTEIYIQQNIDLLGESYRPNAPLTVLRDDLPGMARKRRGRPSNAMVNMRKLSSANKKKKKK
jgi:integrase/recombinase XerD